MQKAILGLMLAGLAGCTSYSGYYQAGQTVAQLTADETGCEVYGVQQVPVNTQYGRTPVRLIPARQICNEAGDCTIIPAEFEGGDLYSYDANADLRARVVAQCMAEKGYQRASVKACSPQVSKVAVSLAPTVLPPLGPNLCVARGADRAPIFVTTAPSAR